MRIYLLTAVVLLAIQSAIAAPPPHIGYVYPAGGRAGSSFEATVGGQYLARSNAVHVMGDGINAEVIEYIEPEAKRRRKLRRRIDRRLGELERDHSQSSEFDEKEARKTDPMLVDLIKALRIRRPKNPKAQPNAQIEDTVSIRITISPKVQPGRKEIRLASPDGVSNPLVFIVGTLGEVTEPKRTNFRPTPPMKIQSLPVLLNGQILPGEVDRYKFNARKGEQLVFQAQARALMPYLADAVPGWFQAVLAVYDANGNELALVDDYLFDPDPVLFFDVPADGEYMLEIKDAIYRGREDFVYRIAAGQLPFVTGIFPLGGRVDAKTPIAITGKNIPINRLMLDTQGKARRIHTTSISAGGYISNRFPYAIDSLEEIVIFESRVSARSARKISVPSIINGRIEQPGDWDVFSFQGDKGEHIVAEVIARRVGSPLDSILKLTDSRGRIVATNDDHKDPAAGLVTHHADSYMICELPRDDTYYLHIGDVQNKGSDAHAYRLRVSPPRPDFELRLVPPSLALHQREATSTTVHVLRKDGFSGKVTLKLTDAPDGLSLKGRIPAGQDKVKLRIRAAEDTPVGLAPIHLEGSAVIDGETVIRNVIPAQDMMQAFLWRQLVPAEELIVMVKPARRFALATNLREGDPLLIPFDGSVKIEVRRAPGSKWGRDLKLSLSDPPDGIVMDPAVIKHGKWKVTVVIRTDGSQLKPGAKGNLVISAWIEKKKLRHVCDAPLISYVIVEPSDSE